MSEVIREDIIQVRFDTDTSELDQVDSGLDKLQKNSTSGFKKISSSIGSGLKTAAMVGIKATAAATAAMGGLLAKGVQYNNQMQTYQTSFETLLGSQEKADAMVSDLKKMADTTPFEMTDMSSAAQTLLGFGMAGDKILPTLENIGDVSQGNAERFSSLSLAFAQVQAAGKLTGQDLLQMINAGFNPLQTMSEKTGKSMATLKEEMSKGAISADMVAEAFEAATSEGGRFYKSMEKQSKTFSGQMSTLSDNANTLLGAITKGLQSDLAENILPQVNEQITALNTAFEEGGLDGLIEKLPSVVDELFTTLATKVVESLPRLVPLAISIVSTLASTLISLIPQLIGVGAQILVSIANGMSNNQSSLTSMIPQLINSLVNGIVTHLPTIIQAGITIIVNLAVGLIQAIPAIISALPLIIKAIWDGLCAVDWKEVGKSIISSIGEGITNLGHGLGNSLATVFSKYKDPAKSDGKATGDEYASGITSSLNSVDLAPTGSNIMGTLASGIDTSKITVDTSTLTVADSVTTTMDGVDLATQGTNMITSLAGGITDAKPAAVSAAADVANSINAEFAKIQQINSPSKVWTKFGTFLPTGLAKGVIKAAPTAQKAVEKVGAVTTPSSGGYTPASSIINSSKSAEYNTYSPQFNLTISGSTDDRVLARKVKRWVNESVNETFESMGRKNLRVRET